MILNNVRFGLIMKRVLKIYYTIINDGRVTLHVIMDGSIQDNWICHSMCAFFSETKRFPSWVTNPFIRK